ncbi:MAG: ABC transporter permease [Gemmatimonadaceae bacterium]
MATLYHELLLAIRSLRRSPTFTIVSILSLAVGIGANVAVFSLVNALLIRPLPVREPERLVRIGRVTRDNSFGSVSFPEYRDLRDGTTAFSELIAHYPNTAILTAGDEPRTAWLELVTPNYFSALGVRLPLGRGFVAASDRAANEGAEMVISHSLWQQRFGGDPAVLSRVVKLNGKSFTLVGVAPPDFRGTFTGFDIDTWVPVAMQAVAIPQAGSIDQREDRFLMLMGRLRPGATRDNARGELAVLAQRLHLGQRDTTEQVRLDIASAGGVHPFVAQIVATFLALLQGIVFLVLLLACVNLANVLLVRASVRRRELATRAALGASRWRLARLLLAETLVIAVVGGVMGVVLAVLAGRALERINLPVGIPLGISMNLDGRVTVVALAITLIVAVAFGAGPALAASRADALADLRVGGATSDRRRGRIRSILVGAQVMLATVLLVGSSLLLRSMQRSQSLDPGFDASSIQLISASPELLGYDEERGRALWNEIVERASRVPGVRDATLALFVPLGSRGDLLGMAPAEVGTGKRREPERLPYNYVRPGYFKMLGIPLVAGRDFLPADDSRAAGVIVISETMARRFFGKENAIGRVVGIVDREGRERRVEVVGVARDIKVRSMGEPPSAIAYLPFGQWYRPDMILHLRAEGGGGSGMITRQVMGQVRSIEPDLALEIEPMTRATEFSLIPLRVAGSVLGFSGFVGLFLASLGVFGLVAYAVSLRTREIGIRMALGAGRAAVVRLVAFEGMRPVLIGLVLGLVAAFGAGQLLRRLLVGIGPSDPVTLVTVCAVLLVSAAAAVIVPVRRAVLTDPARVLRMD